MFVKPFRYEAAASLDEAMRLQADLGPGARLVAGGQSLLPLMNIGMLEVDALIDIRRLPGLGEIRLDGSVITIGSLTTHRRIERSDAVARGQPLLAAGVGHIGSPRIRNVGTLGGSLAHNDPAAELPLIMAVLGATYDVARLDGQRTVPAVEFGRGAFTTDLAPGEVLVAASVPVLQPDWGWGFHEFAHRPGDFAIVAAAALARCHDGVIQQVRLCLSGIASEPISCRAFEQAATGGRVTELDPLVELVLDGCSPPQDGVVSADYRAHLGKVLAHRAVADACRRSQQGGP